MSRELPAGWRSLRLAALIRALDAGVSVNSESRQKRDGEKGILKTSAVSAWNFDPSEHKTITAEEIDRARVSPKADHILLSRMNTPALVGASAYVDRDHPDLFLPDRLWQIDVNDRREASVRWLSYTLASGELRKKLSEIATGTSGSMKNIAKSSLLELEILVPPIDEQRGIAEILSSVDETIQATQAVIEQNRKVKQSVLKRLLTKGIGHTKFKQTEIGEIPEGWEIRTLEEISLVERGKFSVRPRNDPRYYGGSIPFVQTGDITKADGELVSHSQTLNEDGLSVSKLFPAQCILITIAANIGDTAITTYPVCCPDSVVAIQPLSGTNVFWLREFLESQKGNLDRQATRNAQKNINLQHLKPIRVPIPPREEQDKIGEQVNQFGKAIRTLNNELRQLTAMKSALMSDLLTGRKRAFSDLAMAAE